MHYRDDKIKGLRALADWLESTPEALPDEPCWDGIHLNVWPDGTDDEKKQKIIALAQAGSIDKHYGGNYMDLRKDFGGGVKYEMSIKRDLVCTKRVVGTKTVEKRDPELVEQVPMIEVEEDVVEWDCHPLLAPTED
jgi:hypothetical protein